MDLIHTQSALQEVGSRLTGATALFVDTEFDSGRGGTDLCILQISDGTTVYLIDALRLSSFEPLVPAFRSADWVLHAGLQDVGLITRSLRLETRPRSRCRPARWR